jgi:hypothetical protein
MDVLVGNSLTLSRNGNADSGVRLVEHLGAMRRDR